MPVTVQGPAAAASIARAVTALSRSDCDVIAVVRGGERGRTWPPSSTRRSPVPIAVATKPVFTGIGHTGDETVADIVAARVCITPTECGQQIVAATRRVVGGQRGGARRSSWPAAYPAFLDEAQARDTQARSRLTAAARQQLRVHRERLGRKGLVRIGRRAPDRLDASCRRGCVPRRPGSGR